MKTPGLSIIIALILWSCGASEAPPSFAPNGLFTAGFRGTGAAAPTPFNADGRYVVTIEFPYFMTSIRYPDRRVVSTLYHIIGEPRKEVINGKSYTIYDAKAYCGETKKVLDQASVGWSADSGIAGVAGNQLVYKLPTWEHWFTIVGSSLPFENANQTEATFHRRIMNDLKVKHLQ